MEIPAVVVDGMDVWAVQAAAEGAAGARPARRGPGVRRGAHVPLRRPLSQRSREVPAAGRAGGWRARDPLLVAEQRLTADHGASPDRLREVADDVERELREVEAAALAAPFPDQAVFSEFKG